MAFYDLRDFLESCRKENDLIEVDRYVDVNLEMGKALKKSYANNGPVIIFRNNGTDYPAVGGVFGNRKKALRALNAQNNTVLPWFAETIDRPIAPVMVKSAPCQEIIIEGEDVDLGKFPIPKFSELDGGPYLTAGISISKDPETGIADLGHYRFQAIGKDYFGFMAQPFHRLGKNCNKAKALGMKKFEMALVVGTDPVLAYTCQVQNVPDTTDDWSLAGALRGQPVELVKCRTIDVEVPATAEFVFELEIDFETEVSEHSRSTITQKTDAILMTPAEVWFLRAEAALRGWSGEDAGTCYEQGVRSSFNQWRVGEANAYLQSDHVAADFVDTFTPDYSAKALCLVSPAWDEEASRETKLEKIITQKWIACYPEGCEAWAEQRRTGYPRLFPVLVNKSNGKIDMRTMIRRLNFPVSIISGNPAQYSALCEYLGGPDTGGTRLWWDTGVNFRD